MNFKSILGMALGLVVLIAPIGGMAGHGDVKISVALSPAGSFVAESTGGVEVAGYARKNGAQLVAQNIVIDLNQLKTGISLRDRHMKEKYFETGKPGFEKAVLKNAVAQGGKFAGDLTVHGVTQKVSGTYELNGGKFIGRFKTKLSDFKIAQAKYMGVGVEDEVEVEVSLPESGVAGTGGAAPGASASPSAKSAKPQGNQPSRTKRVPTTL